MSIDRRAALQLLAAVIIPGGGCVPSPQAPRAPRRLFAAGRVADDAAPDWSTATPLERKNYAFVSDEIGRIDPADASTSNCSIVQEG